jgi:DNA-binding FrmR family transcriptional regulator
MSGYSGDKDAFLQRMRRVEGQVRGILRHCVAQAAAEGGDLADTKVADTKVAEAGAAIARLVKS